MPKMKRFSSPASSAISTLAPSMVPMVRAPFSMNFMFPVPEASVPAVEICSDRSDAGMTADRRQVERSRIYVFPLYPGSTGPWLADVSSSYAFNLTYENKVSKC